MRLVRKEVAAFASPGGAQRGAVELPAQGGAWRFASAVELHVHRDEAGVAGERIAGAHLSERFLRGDAAIHDPDALGLAVLLFDLREEVLERGFVGGVAGQHFVGEREAFGRDDKAEP